MANPPAHSTYASLPNLSPGTASVTEAFSRLVEQGVLQTQIARQLLDRAEKGAIFDSRRLGSNWNGVYLALLKHYISAKTGWHRAEIMGAITHLVTAAHDALRRRPPANLRVLLQKAIRHFEENPDNELCDFVAREGGGLRLLGLSCSADQCQGANFTVSDATTGQKLSDYSDGSVHGVLACYSAKPERFTFLTVSDNRKLPMVEAAAK